MMRTLALVALLAAGCGGGAHLSDSYGRRTRATFAGQRVAAEPAREAPAGLDSEEAAIVHGAYRESLGAPKARASDDAGSRVLLIEEPTRAQRK